MTQPPDLDAARVRLEDITEIVREVIAAFDSAPDLGEQVRRHLRVKAGMVMSDQVFAEEAAWLRGEGRQWLADLIDPGQPS